MNNSSNFFNDFAAAGIIGVVIFLIVTVGVIALEIWIVYTIIWRAVRRGLREHDKLVIGQRPPY